MPNDTRTLLMLDLPEGGRLSEFNPVVAREMVEFTNSLAESLAREWNGTVHIPLSLEDSLLVVFTSASCAIEMASSLHRKLFRAEWMPARSICRTAIVSGDFEFDEESPVLQTLYSLKQNARAGQILISEATHAISRHAITAEHTFLNLGVHHLDDAQRAQTLYQLLHLDLPHNFQPLPSLLTVASNIPRGLTPFIGRAVQVREVRDQFYLSRVVVLNGFSGVGKSRLAIKVAQDMLEDHYHGAFYADISGVQQRGQVLHSLATAMGVFELSGATLESAVLDRLRSAETLLILDNADSSFAELPSVVDRVVNLCPHVQVLITCRKPLYMAGSQPYSVQPLEVPADGEIDIDNVVKVDSVALFINRAEIAIGSISLTPTSASQIAFLCRRLEGIPLAIELAASKLSTLSLDGLLESLSDRFWILKPSRNGGVRTLENAVRWSYRELNPREKELLRDLAVFQSEFTLEAALSISAPGWDRKESRDTVESLLRQAFLVRTEHHGREYFRMLETIREFGIRLLIGECTVEQMKERHAAWYASHAAELHVSISQGGQSEAAAELDHTYRNFKASLEWSLGSEDDPHAPQLACALEPYWLLRCHFAEGLGWASQILRENKSMDSRQRAQVHNVAGAMACALSDHPRAERHFSEARHLARLEKDKRILCRTEALSGSNSLYAGVYNLGRLRLTEAVAIARTLHDPALEADSLHRLAEALIDLQDFAEAKKLLLESIAINERENRRIDLGSNYWALGRLARLQGNVEDASEALEKAFTLYNEFGDHKNVACALREYAFMRVASGAFHTAATLLGAENSLRRRVGANIPLAYRAEADKNLLALRNALGNRFMFEFATGAEMTVQQIAEFILLRM
jgi:non-specific serine/threonine protein kinase